LRRGGSEKRFKPTLERALFWSFLGIVLINLVGLFFLYGKALRVIESKIEKVLLLAGEVVKEEIPEIITFLTFQDKETLLYQKIHQKLERIKLLTQVDRITIFTPKEIIIDTDAERDFSFLAIDKDEISTAFRGIKTSSYIYRGEEGRLYKCAYLPFSSHQKEVLIRIKAGVDYFKPLINFREYALWLQGGLLLIAVGLSVFFSKRIFRPLEKLVKVVKQICEGNLTPSLKLSSRDEVGFLAESFSQMQETIKARFSAEKAKFEEKLTSLKKLASVLAHEVRNPLASLRSSVELIMRELKEERYQKFFLQILKEIERLNALVERFSDFSRASSLQLRLVNLEGIINTALTLANFPPQIILEKHFPSSLPLVTGDENLLKSCFLNLFLNAKEAMGERGKLVCELRRDGEGILIKIKDSGKGMPEELIKKIPRPFFTTKAKGLGLGLAVSYEVVDKHGGKIWFTSKPSQGTEFYLWLPITQK
jgi:signal transduction histidine kinase